MIKSIVSLLTILSFQNKISTERVAVDIEKRIEILKHQIIAEIIDEQMRAPKMSPTLNPNDYYEYLVRDDDDDEPIKPIIQYHDMKKHKHKHKHHKNKDNLRKPIKKQRTLSTQRLLSTQQTVPTTTIGKKISKATPSNVFYRRLFLDDEDRNKPQKWTHCLDLITPYLDGIKDNMTGGYKKVSSRDGTVVRLTQLLSMNTTDSTKDDIISILYQISGLHLRIFQWDVNAITSLFNVIIPGKEHSFRTLKAGLKAIFARWHLDTTNIATFIEQTRVFRPPCIAVSEFGGSTKTPKSERYEKITTKNSDNEDC